MKIKEVNVGVKISKNYDSYSASLTAEIQEGESPEKVGEELMQKSLKIVLKEIENSGKVSSEKEVGAAWAHKISKDKLSVKMKKGDLWRDVNIDDLEKIRDGYKEQNNEGVFVYRKIPENKRINNKMPLFRIYKLNENFK